MAGEVRPGAEITKPAPNRHTGTVISRDNGGGHLIQMDDSDSLACFWGWEAPAIRVNDRVSFNVYFDGNDEVDVEYVAKEVQPESAEAPPATSLAQSTGTVKWFNDKKSYGFIVIDGDPDDLEHNVFVHFSAIQMEGFKTLDEGDRVSFEVVDGKKGLKAQNVVKLDEPTSKGVE